MKLLIEYKGETIGSLSAGQTAIVPKGKKFTDDIVVRAVVEEVPKLLAPTLSISGDIISITNNNDVGVGYWVYVNGELTVTIAATNSTAVDMSGLNLEAGTYSVYLVAVLDGYENSEQSNTVEYVVEGSVPTNLTGYTVTVPAGWSCLAIRYDYVIDGVLNSYPNDVLTGFTFGYNGFIGQTASNTIFAWGSFAQEMLTPGTSFSFSVTGGDDADKPSLIQWLVDNNATFEKTA